MLDDNNSNKIKQLNIKKSSNIKIASYDAINKELYITFNNGGEYKYLNVNQDVIDSFLKADSVGSFLAKNIKNNYDYEKIEK